MAICGEEPDIIFVTEVLPKASGSHISPALLSLPGYTLYTYFGSGVDGPAGGGIRGVCIYLHENLFFLSIFSSLDQGEICTK